MISHTDSSLKKSLNSTHVAEPSKCLLVNLTPQAKFKLSIQRKNLITCTLRSEDIIRLLPSVCQTPIKPLEVNDLEDTQLGNSETASSRRQANPPLVKCDDLPAAAEAPTEQADRIEVHLVWLGGQSTTPDRQYLPKLAAPKAMKGLPHIQDHEYVSNSAQLAAKALEHDVIATINLSTATPQVLIDHALDSFALRDRQTREPVGDFAARRTSNIHWQALEIDKAERAALKKQTPRCLWFTGLSGSGKSTIASLLEKRLHTAGQHTYVLDGDNLRHGLNRDLGFTEAERVENIRRVAEVAKLMTDAGLIVLVSFISPFAREREMARSLFDAGEFIEVFVDTPLCECERRDVKGLYAKARRGELKNFTGIDSVYEPPSAPEVHLYPAESRPEDCVETLLRALWSV